MGWFGLAWVGLGWAGGWVGGVWVRCRNRAPRANSTARTHKVTQNHTDPPKQHPKTKKTPPPTPHHPPPVPSWNRLKWPPFLTIVVVGLFPSLLVSCMNQIEGIDQQHLISCRTCKNPRIQKTKNKKQKY